MEFASLVGFPIDAVTLLTDAVGFATVEVFVAVDVVSVFLGSDAVAVVVTVDNDSAVT